MRTKLQNIDLYFLQYINTNPSICSQELNNNVYVMALVCMKTKFRKSHKRTKMFTVMVSN